jgi:hypothetical protein
MEAYDRKIAREYHEKLANEAKFKENKQEYRRHIAMTYLVDSDIDYYKYFKICYLIGIIPIKEENYINILKTK